jgi:AhpD family alkylhydroperoxidase
MATRKIDWINNFWKVLAHHPASLKRTWESLKEVMAPGALDPLFKEMIYLAVSTTNNCEYRIGSHGLGAQGQTTDICSRAMVVGTHRMNR